MSTDQSPEQAKELSPVEQAIAARMETLDNSAAMQELAMKEMMSAKEQAKLSAKGSTELTAVNDRYILLRKIARETGKLSSFGGEIDRAQDVVLEEMHRTGAINPLVKMEQQAMNNLPYVADQSVLTKRAVFWGSVLTAGAAGLAVINKLLGGIPGKMLSGVSSMAKGAISIVTFPLKLLPTKMRNIAIAGVAIFAGMKIFPKIAQAAAKRKVDNAFAGFNRAKAEQTENAKRAARVGITKAKDAKGKVLNALREKKAKIQAGIAKAGAGNVAPEVQQELDQIDADIATGESELQALIAAEQELGEEKSDVTQAAEWVAGSKEELETQKEHEYHRILARTELRGNQPIADRYGIDTFQPINLDILGEIYDMHISAGDLMSIATAGDEAASVASEVWQTYTGIPPGERKVAMLLFHADVFALKVRSNQNTGREQPAESDSSSEYLGRESAYARIIDKIRTGVENGDIRDPDAFIASAKAIEVKSEEGMKELLSVQILTELGIVRPDLSSEENRKRTSEFMKVCLNNRKNSVVGAKQRATEPYQREALQRLHDFLADTDTKEYLRTYTHGEDDVWANLDAHIGNKGGDSTLGVMDALQMYKYIGMARYNGNEAADSILDSDPTGAALLQFSVLNVYGKINKYDKELLRKLTGAIKNPDIEIPPQLQNAITGILSAAVDELERKGVDTSRSVAGWARSGRKGITEWMMDNKWKTGAGAAAGVGLGYLHVRSFNDTRMVRQVQRGLSTRRIHHRVFRFGADMFEKTTGVDIPFWKSANVNTVMRDLGIMEYSYLKSAVETQFGKKPGWIRRMWMVANPSSYMYGTKHSMHLALVEAWKLNFTRILRTGTGERANFGVAETRVDAMKMRAQQMGLDPSEAKIVNFHKEFTVEFEIARQLGENAATPELKFPRNASKNVLNALKKTPPNAALRKLIVDTPDLANKIVTQLDEAGMPRLLLRRLNAAAKKQGDLADVLKVFDGMSDVADDGLRVANSVPAPRTTGANTAADTAEAATDARTTARTTEATSEVRAAAATGEEAVEAVADASTARAAARTAQTTTNGAFGTAEIVVNQTTDIPSSETARTAETVSNAAPATEIVTEAPAATPRPVPAEAPVEAAEDLTNAAERMRMLRNENEAFAAQLARNNARLDEISLREIGGSLSDAVEAERTSLQAANENMLKLQTENTAEMQRLADAGVSEAGAPRAPVTQPVSEEATRLMAEVDELDAEAKTLRKLIAEKNARITQLQVNDATRAANQTELNQLTREVSQAERQLVNAQEFAAVKNESATLRNTIASNEARLREISLAEQAGLPDEQLARLAAERESILARNQSVQKMLQENAARTPDLEVNRISSQLDELDTRSLRLEETIDAKNARITELQEMQTRNNTGVKGGKRRAEITKLKSEITQAERALDDVAARRVALDDMLGEARVRQLTTGGEVERGIVQIDTSGTRAAPRQERGMWQSTRERMRTARTRIGQARTWLAESVTSEQTLLRRQAGREIMERLSSDTSARFSRVPRDAFDLSPTRLNAAIDDVHAFRNAEFTRAEKAWQNPRVSAADRAAARELMDEILGQKIDRLRTRHSIHDRLAKEMVRSRLCGTAEIFEIDVDGLGPYQRPREMTALRDMSDLWLSNSRSLQSMVPDEADEIRRFQTALNRCTDIVESADDAARLLSHAGSYALLADMSDDALKGITEIAEEMKGLTSGMTAAKRVQAMQSMASHLARIDEIGGAASKVGRSPEVLRVVAETGLDDLNQMLRQISNVPELADDPIKLAKVMRNYAAWKMSGRFAKGLAIAGVGAEIFSFAASTSHALEAKKRVDDQLANLKKRLTDAGFKNKGDMWTHTSTGVEIEVSKVEEQIHDLNNPANVRMGIDALTSSASIGALLYAPSLLVHPAGLAVAAVQIIVHTGIEIWEQSNHRDFMHLPMELLAALGGTGATIGTAEHDVVASASNWMVSDMWKGADPKERAMFIKKGVLLSGYQELTKMRADHPDTYMSIAGTQSPLEFMSENGELYKNGFDRIIKTMAGPLMFQIADATETDLKWLEWKQLHTDEGTFDLENISSDQFKTVTRMSMSLYSIDQRELKARTARVDYLAAVTEYNTLYPYPPSLEKDPVKRSAREKAEINLASLKARSDLLGTQKIFGTAISELPGWQNGQFPDERSHMQIFAEQIQNNMDEIASRTDGTRSEMEIYGSPYIIELPDYFLANRESKTVNIADLADLGIEGSDTRSPDKSYRDFMQKSNDVYAQLKNVGHYFKKGGSMFAQEAHFKVLENYRIMILQTRDENGVSPFDPEGKIAAKIAKLGEIDWSQQSVMADGQELEFGMFLRDIDPDAADLYEATQSKARLMHRDSGGVMTRKVRNSERTEEMQEVIALIGKNNTWLEAQRFKYEEIDRSKAPELIRTTGYEDLLTISDTATIYIDGESKDAEAMKLTGKPDGVKVFGYPPPGGTQGQIRCVPTTDYQTGEPNYAWYVTVNEPTAIYHFTKNKFGIEQPGMRTYYEKPQHYEESFTLASGVHIHPYPSFEAQVTYMDADGKEQTETISNKSFKGGDVAIDKLEKLGIRLQRLSIKDRSMSINERSGRNATVDERDSGVKTNWYHYDQQAWAFVLPKEGVTSVKLSSDYAGAQGATQTLTPPNQDTLRTDMAKMMKREPANLAERMTSKGVPFNEETDRVVVGGKEEFLPGREFTMAIELVDGRVIHGSHANVQSLAKYLYIQPKNQKGKRTEKVGNEWVTVQGEKVDGWKVRPWNTWSVRTIVHTDERGVKSFIRFPMGTLEEDTTPTSQEPQYAMSEEAMGRLRAAMKKHDLEPKPDGLAFTRAGYGGEYRPRPDGSLLWTGGTYPSGKVMGPRVYTLVDGKMEWESAEEFANTLMAKHDLEEVKRVGDIIECTRGGPKKDEYKGTTYYVNVAEASIFWTGDDMRTAKRTLGGDTWFDAETKEGRMVETKDRILLAYRGSMVEQTDPDGIRIQLFNGPRDRNPEEFIVRSEEDISLAADWNIKVREENGTWQVSLGEDLEDVEVVSITGLATGKKSQYRFFETQSIAKTETEESTAG